MLLILNPSGVVSIHALLAECDSTAPSPEPSENSFTPRTPCGVRHIYRGGEPDAGGFNPRTPCGVRLMDIAAAVDSGNVSIHALLAECDL